MKNKIIQKRGGAYALGLITIGECRWMQEHLKIK